MAKAEENRASYSGFERFLFLITPILFTAVVLGVLLLVVNRDWRQAAFDVGNKIPLVKAIIPDPPVESEQPPTEEELTVGNAKTKIEELSALLAEKEEALRQATAQTTQSEEEIEQLQTQVEQLTKSGETSQITAEAYKARIDNLAKMYGKMTPGKAAPILESMTLEESALVIGAMGDNERGRVMEKMTPKRAAEVTVMLKDADSVEDQEIAALQSRVKQLESQLGEDLRTLDTAELNNTFSAMDPAKAAELLLQMVGTNQTKVLTILNVLGDASRSAVLQEMSALDKRTTASLVSRLMPVNS